MNVEPRADELFVTARQRVHVRTHRLFMWLLLVQWVSAIILALVLSPYTWAGRTRSVQIHVFAAVVLGGLINIAPFVLVRTRPHWAVTRHVIAVSQMLWSALFIHLTGGRIETHFHVFGSLAFLAFYRDVRILATAAVVTAIDHALRGVFWPESVYGVATPEALRFLEHVFWVAFIDLFLGLSCHQSLGEMRDVARRSAELEDTMDHLDQEKTLLSAQSDASVEGVLIIDAEQRVRSFNKRFAEIWGLDQEVHRAASDDALIARVIDRLDDPEAFLASVRHHYADIDSVGTEELRLKDGRVIERYTAPVRSPTGTHYGRGWYFRDITRTRVGDAVAALNLELEDRITARTHELASIVDELQRTRDQLVAADRLKSLGQLSAGVAHEINNPLAYVMSNLAYLDEELTSASPDELRTALRDATHGAERVRRIVSSLKAFSRTDEERQVIVDLHEVVLSACKLAENEIRHRGKLIVEAGATPPILGDATRLGQVFLNLLINAAHALNAPGREDHSVRIVLSTNDHGEAVAEVSDTGCGIDPSIRDRIFEPFFTTKPIGIGTGLGLSLCHGIVTAHGGTISVTSTVGSGSRFRIVLPAAPPIERDILPASVRFQQARRLRVLIVDDEPQVLAVCGRLLAKTHDIELAGSGAEAIARIHAGERFDAILCDLMMPQMTGMAVHAAIQSADREQSDKMAFVTGGVFTADAHEFIQGRRDRILEKPFTKRDVLALLEQISNINGTPSQRRAALASGEARTEPPSAM